LTGSKINVNYDSQGYQQQFMLLLAYFPGIIMQLLIYIMFFQQLQSTTQHSFSGSKVHRRICGTVIALK